MKYPADFVKELKDRSNATCECERGTCHPSPGRCSENLAGEPGGEHWAAVMTGDRITFPPVAMNYIALCRHCAVPRAGELKELS